MKDVNVEYPMYFGAKHDTFKKAKELRKSETKAEKLLWARLSKKQLLGLHFRRQHPINCFIADFYCPKIKLVIEVDGDMHELLENKEYDIERTELLNEFGVKVIRFTNNEIINSLVDVVNKIEQLATESLAESRESPPNGGFRGSLEQ
jgi:very-short-patch-repair endonuclease